jgi:deoxyribodipyrimidine photo-lyase
MVSLKHSRHFETNWNEIARSDKQWGLDERHVRAWKEGRTGYPLPLGGCQRARACRYWIHVEPWQAKCVLVPLAIDMNQDWRFGADYFESILLDYDYDAHSNWGNWCSGKYREHSCAE